MIETKVTSLSSGAGSRVRGGSVPRVPDRQRRHPEEQILADPVVFRVAGSDRPGESAAIENIATGDVPQVGRCCCAFGTR